MMECGPHIGDVEMKRGAFLPRKLKVISIQTVTKRRDSESGGRVPREPGFREVWAGALGRLGGHKQGGSLGEIPTTPTEGKLSALPKGPDFLKWLWSLESLGRHSIQMDFDF